MEAVTADLELFIQLVGQGVHIRFRGHAHAEFRIENGHVGHAGEELFSHFNTHEVGGIVQGAEQEAIPDDVLDVLIHPHRVRDGFAAVQHAMADGEYFALVLDDAHFRIGQQGDDQLHGLHMGGEGRLANQLVFLVRIRGDFVGQATAGLTDALGKAGAEHALRVHLQQLIFARRGTRVDHQYFHIPSFFLP